MEWISNRRRASRSARDSAGEQRQEDPGGADYNEEIWPDLPTRRAEQVETEDAQLLTDKT